MRCEESALAEALESFTGALARCSTLCQNRVISKYEGGKAGRLAASQRKMWCMPYICTIHHVYIRYVCLSTKVAPLGPSQRTQPFPLRILQVAAGSFSVECSHFKAFKLF